MFSKTDKNYLVDITLVVIGFVCTFTGLALSFEPKILKPLFAAINISFIHEWTGYIFLFLMICHLTMHSKWLNAVTKNIIDQKTKAATAFLTVLLSIGLCTAISILSPDSNSSEGNLANRLDMVPYRKPSQDYNPNTKESGTPQMGKAKYADGTYTGNASGYRPGLVVEITITSGVIAKISIISHNEKDPRHYGLAMKRIPEEIIKNQTTSVDDISGATKTSRGIKNAVNDALAKATKQ